MEGRKLKSLWGALSSPAVQRLGGLMVLLERAVALQTVLCGLGNG